MGTVQGRDEDSSHPCGYAGCVLEAYLDQDALSSVRFFFSCAPKSMAELDFIFSAFSPPSIALARCLSPIY